MEISIDSAQLSQINSSDLITKKIEDDIDSLINKTFNTVNNPSNFFSENIELNAISFGFHKSGSISLYGIILKNNQTRYNIDTNSKVFIFIHNKTVYNSVMEQIKNKIYTLKININDCILIPKTIEEKNKDDIYAFLIILPSIIKLYIILIERIKFTKFVSILLNSSSFVDIMLMSKCLNFIGITPYVNIDSLAKENKYKNNEEMIMISIEKETINTFNYIIDFTGKLLEKKTIIFNLLKFDGILFNLEENDNVQLMPENFSIMIRKNIGIFNISFENSVKYFINHGKIINYINEILKNKLSEEVNKTIINNSQVTIYNLSKSVQNSDNLVLSFYNDLTLINLTN